jgi:hypothetical protein
MAMKGFEDLLSSGPAALSCSGAAVHVHTWPAAAVELLHAAGRYAAIHAVWCNGLSRVCGLCGAHSQLLCSVYSPRSFTPVDM